MPKNTVAMKGLTGQFGDYISMSGMMTVAKVRDRLKSYDEDPGWYQHPPGTLALKATEADLRVTELRFLTERPVPNSQSGSRPPATISMPVALKLIFLESKIYLLGVLNFKK